MKMYRVVIELQSVETMGEVETVERFHLSNRIGLLTEKTREYNFFTRLCGLWREGGKG